MHFFRPAIQFANYFSFKIKFTVLAVLSLLSLLFFFSILFTKQYQVSQGVEAQRNVVNYIQPLRELVEYIAVTRGTTHGYLSGNEGFKDKVLAMRSKASESFKSLQAIDAQYGQGLGLSQTINGLNQNWQTINNTAFESQKDLVFKQYTTLIAEVIETFDTLARQGGLNQNTQASTDYLVNILVDTLPNQVEALGQLRGKGAGILAAQQFTTTNKLVVSNLVTDKYLRAFVKDVRYLFADDEAVKSRVELEFEQVQRDLNHYLQLAKTELVENDTSSFRSDAFFQQGTDTISKLFGLYTKLSGELVLRLDTEAQAANSRMALYLLFIVGNILLLVYAYIGMYKAIVVNLKHIKEVSSKVCDGDLSVRSHLNCKDELQGIGVALNEIINGLSHSMVEVSNSSQNIAATASQIANESKLSAVGMEQQSEQLVLTSAAITQMNASVAEVAQNAELGAEAAQMARDNAIIGQDVVSQTVAAIEVLASNIEKAAQQMQKLEQNSNSISSILDVIRGVAEQTNLLALNAAIEAARAGEQGRGFAVVADEVRTLAQRTQHSTHEISEVIELIQSGIGTVAVSMRDSQQCTAVAVQKSQEAGNALVGIMKSVEQITDMSVQIATAAEQQSVVAEEVAQSVVLISDVATNAAQSASELADVGSQLAAMSKEMDLVVTSYHLDVQQQHRLDEPSNLVKWNESSALGIDEADRQHKKMVELMNEVHRVVHGNRGVSTITNRLSNLIEFTAVHFRWEEQYLESHRYPDLAAHRKEHEKLLAELRGYRDSVEISNKRQIDEIVIKLNDWLLKHIEHSDSKYARFLQKEGVSATTQKTKKTLVMG